MNTVKTCTAALVMISLGYGIGYIQFKKDGAKNLKIKHPSTMIGEISKQVRPIEKVKQRKQLVHTEPATKAARCEQTPQNLFVNKATEYANVLDDDLYPVYSTEDYQREVEKSIVPQATEVMLKIPDHEKMALLEIIETEEDDSEWGYQYEDQISNFIAENTSHQAINIAQLVCKTNYCQLDVTFDDQTSWMSLYKTMSKQPWWNSTAYQSPAVDTNTHSIILHRMDAEQLYNPEDEYHLADTEGSL